MRITAYWWPFWPIHEVAATQGARVLNTRAVWADAGGGTVSVAGWTRALGASKPPVQALLQEKKEQQTYQFKPWSRRR